MAGVSLTEHAKKNIQAIHGRSNDFNSGSGRNHNRVLLAMISAHAQEIAELFESSDSHYVTETGDLLILCLELLQEAGADADEIMEMCYGRFQRKLTQLINDGKDEPRENT